MGISWEASTSVYKCLLVCTQSKCTIHSSCVVACFFPCQGNPSAVHSCLQLGWSRHATCQLAEMVADGVGSTTNQYLTLIYAQIDPVTLGVDNDVRYGHNHVMQRHTPSFLIPYHTGTWHQRPLLPNESQGVYHKLEEATQLQYYVTFLE